MPRVFRPSSTTRASRAIGLALLSLVLACSPTFNWREIRTDQWAAMFPAKPASGTRTLPLLGASVALTLYSTDVEGTVFAVGAAELPPALADSAEQRARVAQAFERALLANVAGKVVREGPAATSPWTQAGLPPPEIAREIEAEGVRNGAKRRVTARFYVEKKRVIEVIVASDPNVEQREQVETFLAGFRPL
ncbi:MAG TPA: hypothetical protein VFS42_04825 [Burkholderiaceae bacterium]|nr:hypothetical protein [Burkholderiaceae bacterium]